MEDYAPVEKLKHFKRRYACVSGRQVFKELLCGTYKREAGYGGSLVGPETRHQLKQEYAQHYHHQL